MREIKGKWRESEAKGREKRKDGEERWKAKRKGEGELVGVRRRGEGEGSPAHLAAQEEFRCSVPEGDHHRCVRSQWGAILSCQTKITHLHTDKINI